MFEISLNNLKTNKWIQNCKNTFNILKEKQKKTSTVVEIVNYLILYIEIQIQNTLGHSSHRYLYTTNEVKSVFSCLPVEISHYLKRPSISTLQYIITFFERNLKNIFMKCNYWFLTYSKYTLKMVTSLTSIYTWLTSLYTLFIPNNPMMDSKCYGCFKFILQNNLNLIALHFSYRIPFIKLHMK